MFRPLTRTAQQLSREEAIALLRTEPRGVLSVSGDGGYPYGLPMDHWYNDADGCLYFHSGSSGHKIDALRAEPKASFCVMDSGSRKNGDWAWTVRSVIVFGHVEFVEDPEEAIRITRLLSFKYTDDAAYIDDEIRKYSADLVCFRLVPEHITGKHTREA